MTAMGFGHRWCDLMAVLWRTSSSRIMVNGGLGLPFFHKQGLRQGDPLSPMLFTIAIASLHWLFARAILAGALSTLRLPASRLRVSLYADAAALFVAPICHVCSYYQLSKGEVIIVENQKISLLPYNC